MSRFLLPIAVVAVLAAGCAEFDLKKNIPWGAGVDGEFKPPMKVAAIWTDTVLNVANNHMMQHGAAAFSETVDRLRAHALGVVGIASPDRRSCVPYRMSVRGLRVTVLERPWKRRAYRT